MEDDRIYLYGMKLRGCSPGAQPKGFCERRDSTTGRYYDILVYPFKLSDSDLCNYDLDYIGTEVKK